MSGRKPVILVLSFAVILVAAAVATGVLGLGLAAGRGAGGGTYDPAREVFGGSATSTVPSTKPGLSAPSVGELPPGITTEAMARRRAEVARLARRRRQEASVGRGSDRRSPGGRRAGDSRRAVRPERRYSGAPVEPPPSENTGTAGPPAFK